MTIVRSVSFDQREILGWIKDLHCDGEFDADITFGGGQFYSGADRPRLCFDIDPVADGVIRADSRSLPLSGGALSSIVFDPPFLTYIRAGRGGNGAMRLARRFSGFWTFDELAAYYRDTFSEVARVLEAGGVMVFKCQDIVHNHRLHPTHALSIGWAAEVGLSLVDLFVLPAKHRMPSPNRRGTQRHARIFHSYFLVFKKAKNG